MSWGMKGTTVSAPRPFPSFGHGTAPATLRSPVYLTQGALVFCKNAKMARGAAWGWVNPVGWWLIGGLFYTNQYIAGNFTIHEPGIPFPTNEYKVTKQGFEQWSVELVFANETSRVRQQEWVNAGVKGQSWTRHIAENHQMVHRYMPYLYRKQFAAGVFSDDKWAIAN